VVQAETLLLDSAIGRLGGSGTVRLHDEVVALRLMPDIRVGPVQLRAPVRVGGTLAQPNFAAPDNAGAAIGAGLGAILGMQRTPDRGLQDLAQSLGGGGPALPDCATALAAAREGAGSVTAAPTTPTATAPAPPAPAPAPAPRSGGNERVRIGPDLLRGLFGGRR